MNVLFYRGPENLFGQAVRLWTGSRYSHCELEFPVNGAYPGDRFGAHTSGGVLWRPPLNWAQFPHWDRVEVRPLDEGKVLEWCRLQFGERYDWAGILFAQILPLRRHAGSRWFCSELCVAALQQGGLLAGVVPQAIYPGRLHQLLTRA